MGPPAHDAIDDEDDLVGTILDGRWRIESRLGAGGMGTVWRARAPGARAARERGEEEGQPVAVKVLRAEMIHTEDLLSRFQQEVDAASRIGNEHIVSVLGFGQTESGQPYYAMEFCDGPDLLALLKAEGALPWRRAFGLAEQIGSALGVAHEAGIIHRDVKPENFVLVEREDTHGRDFVKVLDFGIAKLMDPDLAAIETRTGVSVGTPEYMSPEQGEGTDLDGRVDVYGVGVLLYQLVTGRVPFEGHDEFEIMQRHMSEIPRSPNELLAQAGKPRVPAIVDAVIMQALEKDREHRFTDMKRFCRSLASARSRDDDDLAAQAQAEAEAEGRRGTQIVLLVGLGLLLVLGLVLVVVFGS